MQLNPVFLFVGNLKGPSVNAGDTWSGRRSALFWLPACLTVLISICGVFPFFSAFNGSSPQIECGGRSGLWQAICVFLVAHLLNGSRFDLRCLSVSQDVRSTGPVLKLNVVDGLS